MAAVADPCRDCACLWQPLGSWTVCWQSRAAHTLSPEAELTQGNPSSMTRLSTASATACMTRQDKNVTAVPASKADQTPEPSLSPANCLADDYHSLVLQTLFIS